MLRVYGVLGDALRAKVQRGDSTSLMDLLFDGSRWIHSRDSAHLMRRVSFFRVVDSRPAGVFAVQASDQGASVVASYGWQLSDVAAGWLRDEFPAAEHPDVVVVTKRPVLVPMPLAMPRARGFIVRFARLIDFS